MLIDGNLSKLNFRHGLDIVATLMNTKFVQQVWFAAVSQVFFSISVCLGLIIMFASFNRFEQNIYR